MAKLFANSGDPDQMPHSAASDLGLHCLPITLLGFSRLQRVNDCWNDRVNHNQISLSAASDLGLHHLLRPDFPILW